jgi:hypothetical protein
MEQDNGTLGIVPSNLPELMKWLKRASGIFVPAPIRRLSPGYPCCCTPKPRNVLVHGDSTLGGDVRIGLCNALTYLGHSVNVEPNTSTSCDGASGIPDAYDVIFEIMGYPRALPDFSSWDGVRIIFITNYGTPWGRTYFNSTYSSDSGMSITAAFYQDTDNYGDAIDSHPLNNGQSELFIGAVDAITGGTGLYSVYDPDEGDSVVGVAVNQPGGSAFEWVLCTSWVPFLSSYWSLNTQFIDNLVTV